MIKVWYNKYKLTPVTAFGSVAENTDRIGALVRVQWNDRLVGYADLHPWPELGDADIDTQLEAWRLGKISPLAEQAMWLAKRDAKLRELKLNAFSGKPKIKNHFFIGDFTKSSDALMEEVRRAGFSTVKFKMGRDLSEEAKFLYKFIKQNPFTVRLDFNAKTDVNEYVRFMASLLPAERERIEFVEDPVPFDADVWTELSKFAPLAIDNEIDKVYKANLKTLPFRHFILKPARQDVDKALDFIDRHDLKVVVTSSLDHPVGVCHAMLLASELKMSMPSRLADCGCLSFGSYRTNSFSSKITVMGPYMTETEGTGIGFDDLFQQIAWINLR